MRLLATMTLLLALGAAACGGGSDDVQSGGDGGSDGGALAGMATKVTLTGGRHAGSHERETKDATCIDYGDLGIGAADLGTVEEGFSGVDFGAKAKTAQGTDDFSVTVSFADPDSMTPAQYRLNPRKQQGTGTAKVTGSAPRYTIDVTGKTAEGVGVAMTIRCRG